MENFSTVKKLGVGINYQNAFIPILESQKHLIDFIEISPDILCEERWNGKSRVLELHPKRLEKALYWGRKFPVVVHGLGLSIGTASGWNQSYIDLLDSFHRAQKFHWHSEHLGFLQTQLNNGKIVNAGVQLPLPFTNEALDIICPRINQLCARYNKPFLLENTTHYLPGMPNDGMDEIDFLNQTLQRTECGLILDLYNLYCNALNFDFDVMKAIKKLDLSRIVEIHIAGGVSQEGLQMDIHSEVVPEPVWEMLEWTLGNASNVSAITYELLEQALNIVKEEGIVAQLERAQNLWRKYIESNQLEKLDVVA